MPTFTIYDAELEYAEEAELLEFANKVRAAGGAETIEAFFPSETGSTSSCLIANALNFGCTVFPTYHDDDGETYHPGERSWLMEFPHTMYGQEAKDIAEQLGCRPYTYFDVVQGIRLPRRIGNAAHAFDVAKDGWVTKYRKDPVSG